MNRLMQRVSKGMETVRARLGRNVFWLALVALLAAALVVPLYLFEDTSPVAVRSPVFRGELRPAPKPPAPKPAPPAPVVEAETPPAEKPPAEKPLAEKPLAEKPLAEKTPAKKPPAAPGDLYQVQLGAFASEARAHRLARSAAGEGFPAVVLELRLAGGKVLHRVRIQGSLPKDQAEALQANVKQKIPSLDPILMAAER